MNATTPRGGKRLGAGRKRDPLSPSASPGDLVRCNVMIDAATAATMRAIGDGNLSLGIRRAAKQNASG